MCLDYLIAYSAGGAGSSGTPAGAIGAGIGLNDLFKIVTKLW